MNREQAEEWLMEQVDSGWDILDLARNLVIKLNNTEKGLTMTRKHFQAIADTISRHCCDANVTPEEQRRLAESFSDLCASTNPRFNRSRFIEACGVSDE